MGKNTVAAFGAPAYEERYVYGQNWLQTSCWSAIRPGVKHVLLDNAANYGKGEQFRRILSPAIGNGLVTADGASWRFQRRTAAPMFQIGAIPRRWRRRCRPRLRTFWRAGPRCPGSVLAVRRSMPRRR